MARQTAESPVNREGNQESKLPAAFCSGGWWGGWWRVEFYKESPRYRMKSLPGTQSTIVSFHFTCHGDEMTHRRREERRSGRTRRRWMRRDLSKNCPRNYSDYLQRRRIRNDWMNDSKALPFPLQFNNYLIKALFLYKEFTKQEKSRHRNGKS